MNEDGDGERRKTVRTPQDDQKTNAFADAHQTKDTALTALTRPLIWRGLRQIEAVIDVQR